VSFGELTNVRQNETSGGVSELNDLLRSLSHTNVIAKNVPHGYDLSPNSRINNEVKAFNRKIV
jgi:hypothetical protein